MIAADFRLQARWRFARRLGRRLAIAERGAERDRMLAAMARPDRR